MKILFVHENFPAQFGAFGRWLSGRGWDARFATAWRGGEPNDPRFLRYAAHRGPTEGVHPYAANLEKAAINGQAAARAFIEARANGYAPDIVMAHSGWGSGMFARDIWPEARFVPYFEWWYEYPPPDDLSLGIHKSDLHAQLLQRVRNAPFLLDLEGADLAFCPTEFQAARFPAALRRQLTVMHDGIDCALHRPAERPVTVAAGLDLAAMPEIVTFITRGMEPHRGFPQFMRALSALQAARPGLHAIIGGEDRVSYGARLPEGESWKARMLAELDDTLDHARIHFVGLQPRAEYVKLLQASDAHVYLTADFVLSWSMLEAMAIGCPLIVSDCAPVREFMDEETGLFCGLHDQAALERRIAEALDHPETMRAKGAVARTAVMARCDRATIWPAKEKLLTSLL
ncbi:glycosyltransferase [Pikeienuella piscinae]|uniref:Glycosyltransferase n=1 Tax=Pikeienuella piscinae TaxID=2748098 RepID=A0A7L5C277_9RHOB|nr:glycosyltransferase [Pikeienuella piscinae]QIE56937.1 glycosyltransferase [Pikeienuella piscinae]